MTGKRSKRMQRRVFRCWQEGVVFGSKRPTRLTNTGASTGVYLHIRHDCGVLSLILKIFHQQHINIRIAFRESMVEEERGGHLNIGDKSAIRRHEEIKHTDRGRKRA
jgi:hypothetical protein